MLPQSFIVILAVVLLTATRIIIANSSETDYDDDDDEQQNEKDLYDVTSRDDNDINDDNDDHHQDHEFILNNFRNTLMYMSNVSWSDEHDYKVEYLQDCKNCQCIALWLAEILLDYDKKRTNAFLANYEKNINITAHNEMMQARADKEFHRLRMNISSEIELFEKHQLLLLQSCGSRVMSFVIRLKLKESLKPSNLAEATAFQSILLTMRSEHSTSVVKTDNATLYLTPNLTNIMANSRNYSQLLWAWQSWHDSSGPKIKKNFTELVRLQNKAAREKGYPNANFVWKFMGTGGVDGKKVMKELMKEIEPFYKELHAFVRRKLVDYYRVQVNGIIHENDFTANGPIPAHILGDMYAQDWRAIEDIVLPYPNHPLPNVTEALINQNYTVKKMFKLSEDFFTSLGFEPMTDVFWDKSVIVRPSNVKIVCHPTAFDIGAKDDYRIKMCGQVDAKNLEIIHHEMGHIVDFMEQRHLPILLRQNCFKEATGDTIALSVMSQTHLQAIGLIDITSNHGNWSNDIDLLRPNESETDINFLMRQALAKVPFLPFSYSLELWRYEVLEEKINSSEYNNKWWEMRQLHQGIAPAVNRSSDKFDPGAKFHIATNYAYSGYFLSYIVQFQFHEALCKESGHVGPLHTCDIYASKRAGKKLRTMLRKGATGSSETLMYMMTGQTNFSSDALLKYFDPLFEWLKRENQGHNTGWSNDS